MDGIDHDSKHAVVEYPGRMLLSTKNKHMVNSMANFDMNLYLQSTIDR